MKKSQAKSAAKYVFSLLLAAFLLWFLLRNVDVETMMSKLVEVEYEWLFVSIFFALISHIARAYRWNILLKPMGYTPPVSHTFLAVMTGYLANLLVPRLGEVARCGVLKKNNDVPLSTSFGTVIAERVLDFLILLFIVFLALVLEFDRLSAFLGEIFAGGARLPVGDIFLYLAGAFVIGSSLLLIFYKFFWNRIRSLAFFTKVRDFVKELLKGAFSIRLIENKVGFWLSTLVIWVMYYLMSYVIVFSLPQTSNIDLMAGLSILAMGGIGMAAPVQGGIGAYHLLVTGTLIAYGASQSDSVLLAFLLHTSQIIFIIIGGGISLLVSFLLERRKNTKKIKYAS